MDLVKTNLQGVGATQVAVYPDQGLFLRGMLSSVIIAALAVLNM